VCGQALSHCVKYTVNDIIGQWSKEKSRIVILSNASSPVSGFEAKAQDFLESSRKQGLTVTTADKAFDPLVDIGDGGTPVLSVTASIDGSTVTGSF
jgi:nicotinamidase/pyrazinamidase